jgi:hypothetical protein
MSLPSSHVSADVGVIPGVHEFSQIGGRIPLKWMHEDLGMGNFRFFNSVWLQREVSRVWNDDTWCEAKTGMTGLAMSDVGLMGTRNV